MSKATCCDANPVQRDQVVIEMDRFSITGVISQKSKVGCVVGGGGMGWKNPERLLSGRGFRGVSGRTTELGFEGFYQDKRGELTNFNYCVANCLPHFSRGTRYSICFQPTKSTGHFLDFILFGKTVFVAYRKCRPFWW